MPEHDRQDVGSPSNDSASFSMTDFFGAWLSRESIRYRIRTLKARFRDQRVEFDAIKEHLSPDAIACDIGANKGSFTYWLARWCPHGRVIAFEPQPEFAGRLSGICKTLGLDNVTVEAKAVWLRSGQHELFVPQDHLPGASLNGPPAETTDLKILTVPTVSLDDYFNESAKVALLKIDAEGAELDIMKGAERILRQHGPLLVFECENRHLAPGTVGDVFRRYRGLCAERDNALECRATGVEGDDVLNTGGK